LAFFALSNREKIVEFVFSENIAQLLLKIIRIVLIALGAFFIILKPTFRFISRLIKEERKFKYLISKVLRIIASILAWGIFLFLLINKNKTIGLTILSILVLLLLIMLFREYLNRLVLFIRGRFMSKGVAPETWRNRVKNTDHWGQYFYLRYTSHNTLGIEAAKFLVILESLEENVTKEPAVSLYWRIRNDLEQMDRQERLESSDTERKNTDHT
jgi:hypothetical protein